MFDIGDAGSWPVCPEQRFVGNLLEAREVFQQRLRGDATDVEVHVWMAAQQEKCGVHPERTATVGEQNFELWKINGDIVDVNGITIFVACAGEDGGSGVKHYWNAIGLSGAINNFQFLHSCQVVIRKKQLVRRMNLDHLNLQPKQLFHVGHDV